MTAEVATVLLKVRHFDNETSAPIVYKYRPMNVLIQNKSQTIIDTQCVDKTLTNVMNYKFSTE